MADASVLTSRAIRGMYYLRLEQNPGLGWVDAVANLFPSDQAGEEYAFLGQSPAFREWIGGRQAQGHRSGSFRIANRHYESTIEFALRDVRRDKTGQIEARLNEWTDTSLAHWGELLTELIVAGESTPCYDGSYFFDTAHSEGESGSQSNDITVDISELPSQLHGTTTAPSVEEMQYMILKGIAQLMTFRGDRGQKLNAGAKQFLVMCPLPYTFTLAHALSATSTQSNASASLAPGNIGFQVAGATNADLPWTDKIVIFRTDSPIKGLIRQQETEVDLKVRAEGSEYEFENDAWQFGLDSWRAADFGFWQRACLVQAI